MTEQEWNEATNPQAMLLILPLPCVAGALASSLPSPSASTRSGSFSTCLSWQTYCKRPVAKTWRFSGTVAGWDHVPVVVSSSTLC